MSRVLLLWAGGVVIIGTATTTGEVLTLLFLASICLGSSFKALQAYGNLMSLVGSLERLFYLFEYQTKINRPIGDIKSSVRGHLEFSKVSFAYPTRKDTPVFKTISFSAKEGQVIGIIGASGSGKSTIVALVEQMYRPSYGYITLDGNKLTDLDPFWARKQIGVITHDSEALFSTTVAANIAYGANTSLEEVKLACQHVGLSDFIESLPQKYDTLIGEKGFQLSVTQQKKMAVARAMVRNYRVLVVDEPTSGMDMETEEVVVSAINKYVESQKRTAVILSSNPQLLNRMGASKIYCIRNHGLEEWNEEEDE